MPTEASIEEENSVAHSKNAMPPAAVHAGWTRRRFLGETAALTASTLIASTADQSTAVGTDDNPRRPRVAALFTHFTAGSHSDLILESFLEPYLFNGQRHTSPCDVVSFYIDKFPRKQDVDPAKRVIGLGADDIGRDVAKSYGIPLYSTIAEALCLGTSELAIDAVLSIGEYGYRPISALSDREFPRWRFLNEMVAVMRRSERVVPVFNDKNFTYRWDWGKEMFDTARRVGIPLMAGSSVPLAERRPALELPPGSPIEELVTVHGGSLEGYDYHGVELLQSLAEGRQGGETGISRVQQLVGDAVWKAADEGRWSVSLAEAALEADFSTRRLAIRELVSTPPRAILIDYADGVRGAALSFGGAGFSAACRLKGEQSPRATSFYWGPWGSRGFFPPLAHAIQKFFVTRTPPYPAERTLLAGGAVDAAMHSYGQGGAPIPTPHLHFGYPTVDWSAFRETGRTWQQALPGTPPPPGLRKDPGARDKKPGKSGGS